MSNISDKDLDKLFQHAAERYESSFEDNAWEKLQERMDPGDSAFAYFKAVAGVIGVFILGALLIWWYSPESPGNNFEGEPQPISQFDVKPGGQEYSEKGGPLPSKDREIKTAENKEKNGGSNNLREEMRTAQAGEEPYTIYDTPISNQRKNSSDADPSSFTHGISRRQIKDSPDEMMSEGHPGHLITRDDPIFLEKLGYLTQPPTLAKQELTLVDPSVLIKKEKTSVGRLALKLAYSPDLTSVGYFTPDRPGSNYGLMVEYVLGNRWSISTGLVYSRKIYFTEEEQRYGYYSGSVINTINGDCRVIDIPVNVSYYLNRSENHSLFITAGSSSYLMLEEIYDYTSVSNGYKHTSSQKIENENNHFFGLLNLSIGYEHRLKGNFFLQLEPFLKAPITGIGEGKIDLVSTGAFLKLKFYVR